MDRFRYFVADNELFLSNHSSDFARQIKCHDEFLKFEEQSGINTSKISLFISATIHLVSTDSVSEDDYEKIRKLFHSTVKLNLNYFTSDNFSLSDLLLFLKIYKKSYTKLVETNEDDKSLKNKALLFLHKIFDIAEIELISFIQANKNSKDSDLLSLESESCDPKECSIYFSIFETSPNPILLVNSENVIFDINKAARKLFFEITDNYFYEGMVDITFPWIKDKVEELRKSSSKSLSFEKTFITKKGPKYYDVKLLKTIDVKNPIEDVTVVMTNITGYKNMTRSLNESKLKYESLFTNMFELCAYNKIILDDNGEAIDFNILDINDSLAKYLNMKKENVIGSMASSTLPFMVDKGTQWLDLFKKSALSGENIKLKEAYIGSVDSWYTMSIYSVTSGYFMIVFSDITEKKKAEQKILHLAYYDSLTGLPNTKHIDNRIEDAIESAIAENKNFAVIFIDIANFKRINSTLGHKAGDFLLQQVSHRLQELLSLEYDSIARHGGDKFILLYGPIEDMSQAGDYAKRISDELMPPFYFNNHEIYLEINIGISMYPDDADNIHALKRNADTAMCSAKKTKGCTFQFHTKEMYDSAIQKLEIENELRHALTREELFLNFQPLVNILSGRIMGFEALLRWKNFDRGNVSPVEFIPVAESTGLILPIGEWVLYRSCEECKKWIDEGFSDLYVSVNVSLNQFQRQNFVEIVKDALDTTGLPPENLCLEITESVFMEDLDNILSSLYKLKLMGIRIFLDDFGTGYSSLNYLEKLPVNTLKIDKSFISRIDSNWDHSVLTKAIISMAHSLGLEVVAEGVETNNEYEFLKEHKCDKIQGYLFSKPIPSSSVIEVLRDNFSKK